MLAGINYSYIELVTTTLKRMCISSQKKGVRDALLLEITETMEWSLGRRNPFRGAVLER